MSDAKEGKSYKTKQKFGHSRGDRRDRRRDRVRDQIPSNRTKRPIILAKKSNVNAEFPSLPNVTAEVGGDAENSVASPGCQSLEDECDNSDQTSKVVAESSNVLTTSSSPSDSSFASRNKTESPKSIPIDEEKLEVLLRSGLSIQDSVKQERSVKVIDESHVTSERFATFLSDTNTDFLVVGVIGLQGVGKSTILNNLIIDGYEKAPVFRTENLNDVMHNDHCTNGIDAWIHPTDRVILLDSEALNSASVLKRNFQLDKKYCAEFSYAETTVEIHSLQIVGLLMNVCHVLLCVQDYFTDVSLLKFLQVAEMLKPSSPTTNPLESSSVFEYFPQFVWVQNKSSLEDFTAPKINEMIEFYKKAFSKSQLHVESDLGFGTGNVLDHLPQDAIFDTSFNLFLLPDLDLKSMSKIPLSWSGKEPFKEIMKTFRSLVLSATKQPLTTNARQTEKAWFQFFMKSWENVKNSSFYVEYSKML